MAHIPAVIATRTSSPPPSCQPYPAPPPPPRGEVHPGRRCGPGNVREDVPDRRDRRPDRSEKFTQVADAAPPLLNVRTCKALVIGAGPSGLVAAKYLLASKSPKYVVTVLESSADSIGGTFSNKVYDNTRLVSSKYITAFSDLRMGDAYPNHPTAEQYVNYLRAYCDRFDLFGRIKFGCEVISVSDAPPSAVVEGDAQEEDGAAVDGNGYVVKYRYDSLDTEEDTTCIEHFDVVAVCSGLHNVPNIPTIPNQHNFRGTVLHSSTYKDPSIFTNKRVLILGSGETAMDIALRAVHAASKCVALCVRRGFLSIPHNLAEDRPLDVFITNLFEHSYEHPWVHATRLRWKLSTIIIRFFLFLTGSSVGFNQWACQVDTVARGYHIINKSHGAMAHLNVPIKRRTLLGRFWLWVYGECDLRPVESFHRTSVKGVDDNGVTVHFDDGRSYDADLIVCATGYRQSFPFLDDCIRDEHRVAQSISSSRNGGQTYEEDFLPSEHFIVSKARPRLGFIGFVRPNVGAIPPMSELQVMWWLCNLHGKVRQLDPSNPEGALPSYMVLGKKYQYGVDYGNYMHRVAEDIDAAPTLSCLAQSSKPLKALYTYCQGQSHIPLFRLQGPYASKICWEVLTDELWRVCVNRGWLENFGLAVVTWLSLWMNLCACLLECLFFLVSLRRPRFFVRY